MVIGSVAKNSQLISQQPPLYFVGRDYHVFAKGYDPGDRKTPTNIAWELEREAVEQGWVVGRFVGSEREFIERFAASRDAVREAIRLLEARGSMLIERGRNGGLRLAEPDLEWAAGAFALFLRASAYSDAQLHETDAIAKPLLEELPGDHLIGQLYQRTLDLLSRAGATEPRLEARGFRIATRLIQRCSPIPLEGIQLGSEDRLCERFSSSRPTFRQALRILDDLGTLQVRRGRGGGYLLKRPSSIGVVRQVFALLASRRQTLDDVLPMKWVLDVVKLRLAMRALQQVDSSRREQHLQSLASVLTYPSEPYRWCLLQQALGRIGRDPMVNTFLWCLVAYHVRVAPSSVPWGEIETELRSAEGAAVQAISEGLETEAELHLRRGQAHITKLLYVHRLGGGAQQDID
jgi:DNA-binding FadR family transcriptional regulator